MNEWISVIINDKTIYVYEPLTMCNSCLRKWNESYAWENTTPAIELIELIITDGVIAGNVGKRQRRIVRDRKGRRIADFQFITEITYAAAYCRIVS